MINILESLTEQHPYTRYISPTSNGPIFDGWNTTDNNGSYVRILHDDLLTKCFKYLFPLGYIVSVPNFWLFTTRRVERVRK